MKKLFLTLSLFLICQTAFGWISESGSGVVSDNEVIVRSSLEATQVLKSDLYSQLLGTTELGGTTNYASYDSGGVLSFRNVASSIDTSLYSINQFAGWVRTDGKIFRSGVSNDGIYTIGTHSRIQGRVSADSAAVASIFTTSINVTQVFVSGNTTITSTYTTGTCSFTFSNGILRSASC